MDKSPTQSVQFGRILLASMVACLSILIWISLPSISKEKGSMSIDQQHFTGSGSAIESGRVRVCGGLVTSVNRSWQVAIKPGQRPSASFKGMAPLATWPPSKTIPSDQGATYLAAVASHDALWIGFEADKDINFAVSIDVDGRNALTGQLGWTQALALEPKNFLLIPDQPWFDAIVGDKGNLQQLIPFYSHVVRPIGFATGAEIRLTVYPIAPTDLDPLLPAEPKGPVPQYSQQPAASQTEPTIHPWVSRNLRRSLKAPRECARLTFQIVEPNVFESLTAIHLPEGMFDDADSTPPPPFQLD